MGSRGTRNPFASGLNLEQPVESGRKAVQVHLTLLPAKFITHADVCCRHGLLSTLLLGSRLILKPNESTNLIDIHLDLFPHSLPGAKLRGWACMYCFTAKAKSNILHLFLRAKDNLLRTRSRPFRIASSLCTKLISCVTAGSVDRRRVLLRCCHCWRTFNPRTATYGVSAASFRNPKGAV